VSILGESGLPPEDQRSLAFAASFEKGRLSQGSARRTLEETMELGWRFLAPFRATELKRVTAQQLAAHHGSQLGPSDQGGVETDVARPDR
jgi:V/A-type H+-transporting ATPase subunit B